MRGRHMLLALAMVALSGSGQKTAAQQATGFAGTWDVEYPGRINNDNGVETVEMAHARLVLRQSADSLTGDWQSLESGPDGKPAPVRRVHGMVQGSHASLEGSGQAIVNRNGEATSITLRIRYELDLAGDAFTGTQRASSSDAFLPTTPRQITGKREAGGT